MAAYYVYSLVDPRNNVVRYIGATADPVARLSGHKYSKHGMRAKVDWIKELRDNGLSPRMDILEVCDTPEQASKRECYYFSMHNSIFILCDDPRVRRYRFNMPKKQYKPGEKIPSSFRLSDEAVYILNHLCKEQKMSKAEVIEMLVYRKAKQLNITVD